MVVVLLGLGAFRAGFFSTTPVRAVALALPVETHTMAGPALPEAFAQRAGKAAVAKAAAPAPIVERAVVTEATRIATAGAFDPEAFADVQGTVLEEGMASYYGDEFAGRPTANGEAFDPEGMTAAHRTLPLGAVIRVTNLRNSRSIIVRVNDRGPFAGDRVLDLSHGAAVALKMKMRGTARIRIEVL